MKETENQKRANALEERQAKIDAMIDMIKTIEASADEMNRILGALGAELKKMGELGFDANDLGNIKDPMGQTKASLEIGKQNLSHIWVAAENIKGRLKYGPYEE